MNKTFSDMVKIALKRIFNRSRFVLIFLGLCSFGFVFLSLLNLLTCSNINFTVPIIGMGTFFLAFSFVFGIGIIVSNCLALEDSEESISFRKILIRHWKKIWNSLMLSMPFFLGFMVVLLVIMMSIFLSMLPILGKFFRVILTFLPFLSLAAVQCLFFGAFVALFLFVPVLALSEQTDYVSLLKMVKKNFFIKIAGFLVAFIPLFLSFKLIWNSLGFMRDLYPLEIECSWERLAQMLILVVPVAFLLTPAIAFFFNFSYEFNSGDLVGKENLNQHN